MNALAALDNTETGLALPQSEAFQGINNGLFKSVSSSQVTLLLDQNKRTRQNIELMGETLNSGDTRHTLSYFLTRTLTASTVHLILINYSVLKRLLNTLMRRSGKWLST